MLNELDKELERRGLQYVCYVDECVIFTKSKKSAERVIHTGEYQVVQFYPEA